MKPYCKITTIFKRDPSTKFKTLLPQYSFPEFEYLANNKWLFTEKIDGTNIRISLQDNVLTFKGRNEESDIPTFLRQTLQEMFTVDKIREVFPDGDICLYGEGYGNRIQKVGKKYLPDKCSFILFDVFCGNYWLRRGDVADVARKLSLRVVPLLKIGTLPEAVEMVKAGFRSKEGDCTAEGLVLRPEVDLFTRGGARIITKIKHKDFRK